jgi:zona occludens toxin (predicted ATPase)
MNKHMRNTRIEDTVAKGTCLWPSHRLLAVGGVASIVLLGAAHAADAPVLLPPARAGTAASNSAPASASATAAAAAPKAMVPAAKPTAPASTATPTASSTQGKARRRGGDDDLNDLEVERARRK